MMSHTQHPEWETLNDFVDGSIAPNARAEVAAHVETCPICRDMAARIRDLVADASSLPQSMDAPREAWSMIAAKIDDAKVVSLGRVPGGASDAHASFAKRQRWIRMTAAAVVLVALSSSVTVMVMQNMGENIVAGTLIPSPPIAHLAALPAEVAAVERTYLSTVDDLVAVLNDPANKFAPGTISAVQRSLKVIDEAIAEARQALLADPASNVLREILSNSYAQKVDLLRRVSERVETS